MRDRYFVCHRKTEWLARKSNISYALKSPSVCMYICMYGIMKHMLLEGGESDCLQIWQHYSPTSYFSYLNKIWSHVSGKKI